MDIRVWVGFNAFILVMLAIDLGVFHREAHEITTREAAIWSAVWVTLSLIFGYGVHRLMGPQAGLEFLTGYLIEKALSVDNIFVFVLIFSYFAVPSKYQHRVLFWGILGALVMRGTLIGAGALLIARFRWILYFFGAFLVYAGARMARREEETIEPESNPVLRLIRRHLPITREYHGKHFMVRAATGPGGRKRWLATPLLIVLIMVEMTDLIFAADSIPAIFAVTHDPFLVYTSNIFAILGLRSLYFLLAVVIDRFHYLQPGLAIVLTFIGVKMLAADVVHIPTALSLGIVAGVLATAVVASLLVPKRAVERTPPRRGSVDPEAAAAVDVKEAVAPRGRE